MQIVKLNAIDSTNAYIKRTLKEKELESNTVVVAFEQYEGRGQMGTIWQSEPGKNLTFSMLKRFDYFKAADHFFINMQVCLSVYKTLKHLGIPHLRIKWPNDILSGSEKICGVLIESIISGSVIKSVIIGIGLNINQTSFANLKGVSSLKLITGNTYNHDEILQMLLSDLKYSFKSLKEFDSTNLHRTYEDKLFMRNTPARFEFNDEPSKEGIIQGITKAGKLRIAFSSEVISEFGFKEVKLLY